MEELFGLGALGALLVQPQSVNLLSMLALVLQAVQ
jgi:hypothetical protein